MKLSQRLLLIALLGVAAIISTSQAQAQPQPTQIGIHSGCDEIGFSRNGRVLVTRSGALLPTSNPQIRFWDVKSQQLIRTVPAGLLDRIDGRGERFLVVNRQRPSSIGYLDSVSNTPKSRIALKWRASKSDDVFDADWSKDGQEVWLLSSKFLLRFNASTGDLLKSSARNTQNYEWLAGDGEHLLSATPSGRDSARLVQLDIKANKTQLLSSRLSGDFSPERLSLDSQLYWTNFIDSKMRGQRFFRVRDNKLLWTWKNHTSTSAFSPDSRLLISFEKKTNLCLGRDAITGRALWQFKGPSPLVFSLSPDTKTLAEAKFNGQILLWPLPQVGKTDYTDINEVLSQPLIQETP